MKILPLSYEYYRDFYTGFMPIRSNLLKGG